VPAIVIDPNLIFLTAAAMATPTGPTSIVQKQEMQLDLKISGESAER